MKPPLFVKRSKRSARAALIAETMGIVCESRKNTSPYPFGSITEFKIRWWG